MTSRHVDLTASFQREQSKAKGAKQSRAKGFNLSHKPAESEEVQREKEHKDVKVFKSVNLVRINLV
jgi:hypothetical protein